MPGKGEGGVEQGQRGEHDERDAEQAVHRDQRSPHIGNGGDRRDRVALGVHDPQLTADQAGGLTVKAVEIQPVTQGVYGAWRDGHPDRGGVVEEGQSEDVSGEFDSPQVDGLAAAVRQLENDLNGLARLETQRVARTGRADVVSVDGRRHLEAVVLRRSAGGTDEHRRQDDEQCAERLNRHGSSGWNATPGDGRRTRRRGAGRSGSRSGSTSRYQRD